MASAMYSSRNQHLLSFLKTALEKEKKKKKKKIENRQSTVRVDGNTKQQLLKLYCYKNQNTTTARRDRVLFMFVRLKSSAWTIISYLSYTFHDCEQFPREG